MPVASDRLWLPHSSWPRPVSRLRSTAREHRRDPFVNDPQQSSPRVRLRVCLIRTRALDSTSAIPSDDVTKPKSISGAEATSLTKLFAIFQNGPRSARALENHDGVFSASRQGGLAGHNSAGRQETILVFPAQRTPVQLIELAYSKLTRAE